MAKTKKITLIVEFEKWPDIAKALKQAEKNLQAGERFGILNTNTARGQYLLEYTQRPETTMALINGQYCEIIQSKIK